MIKNFDKNLRVINEEQPSDEIKKDSFDANANLLKLIHEKGKLKFLWIIMNYGKKYKLLFYSLISVILINSVLISINAYLINIAIQQTLYDVAGSGQNYWDIKYWVWMIICGANLIVMYIFTYYRSALSVRLAVRVEVELRLLVIKRLLDQDISYYSDKKTGEIMTKVVGDTNVIGNEINGLIVWSIQVPFVLVFGSVSIMLVDWKVGLVATISVIVLGIFVACYSITYRKKNKKVRETISSINGDVVDRIGVIKLIKSSATRVYEEKRIREIHRPYMSIFKPVAKIDGNLFATLIASDILTNLLVIAASVIFYNQDVTKFLSILIPITTATVTLTRPLWQMAALIPGISRASASTQQIYEVIKRDPILYDNEEDGVLFDEEIRKIEFRNIKFSYPEKTNVTIISDLNIVFEKGKSYAFVGETGSGKSTISKLLLRFYDPTDGAVLVNDKDLKALNLKSYLSHVGYVEQEPQIIYGNVYDNVRYGYFDATNEEIHEACKKAQVHKIISSWPEGYETVLGERGLLLSGGQKQRLVIARILLKNPELLVLDEATSALDNIVEKEIQSQLNELMIGKTTVVIAHRLTTIKNVDKIFVISPGQGIVQSGTFNELINQDGHFKRLYEAGNS
ncbi:ABC transporter ATP-binding protein [Spiroplasma helicoides]|uniref:ABC transporter ATP-binding protein n=1 Tax=Spiroplasma helicoides TaxID=216938 RepID=A0A1B3SL32_9MOLU|nr:ABC transporter ATP-binding protein [Spiroplasma helicoides]AOG60639.1 ABC transporter ATP-binding protein [Spiroplasma helicoides]